MVDGTVVYLPVEALTMALKHSFALAEPLAA